MQRGSGLVDNTPVQPILDILKQLVTGQPLSETQAEDTFVQVLSGTVDEAQISAVLALIAARGPTVDELVGGARVMRRFVTPVPTPNNGVPVIDTCGTGGAPKLFNVSTAGAIVTAAAAPGRVMVAKHGSLSRTGRGSAEVLQALGVNIAASPVTQARCLEEIGLCFSFSVHHHPAMKHAAGPRKSLGFPTIFNLLGPLTNPAGARRQLVGAYNRELSLKLAETLARLGSDRAMVVTSHDGMDELTTTNTNLTYTVEGGTVTMRVVDAEHLGLPRTTVDRLQVQSLDEAVQAVRATISGEAGPMHDMVLLNAGAALFVAGLVRSLGEGVETARETTASGRAVKTMQRLVELSQSA